VKYNIMILCSLCIGWEWYYTAEITYWSPLLLT